MAICISRVPLSQSHQNFNKKISRMSKKNMIICEKSDQITVLRGNRNKIHACECLLLAIYWPVPSVTPNWPINRIVSRNRRINGYRTWWNTYSSEYRDFTRRKTLSALNANNVITGASNLQTKQNWMNERERNTRTNNNNRTPKTHRRRKSTKKTESENHWKLVRNNSQSVNCLLFFFGYVLFDVMQAHTNSSIIHSIVSVASFFCSCFLDGDGGWQTRAH